MKKSISAFMLTASLAACSSQNTIQEPAIGGQTDAHGCLPSTGASYSFLKQQCVQWFNVADIKLADPDNETLAVYVILSDDKTQAEVSASGLPENTILESVKGGYVSKDGKVRLMKVGKVWKLRK
nr:hypothetical protein [uncultured Haemophilus sp.]